MGKLGKLPQLPGFMASARKLLTGLSDVKDQKVSTKPNEGVYMVDCKNSDFTVETKCAKVRERELPPLQGRKSEVYKKLTIDHFLVRIGP